MMKMDGKEFKAIRVKLRLSQAELGEKLGLGGRFIRYIESGEREMDARTALAMRWLAEHGKPANPAPGRGAMPQRGPRMESQN